jgi:1,2-phenylacetyl-CoA epoxidase catalytic subunit
MEDQYHVLTFPNTQSDAYAKARYHYLLQILFGETMAIDYCKTMATFAPSQEASDFLIRQQGEEDTHLDLLTEYVGSHLRPEVLISPALKKLHYLMADAIQRRDYAASVFVQNFIVEGLNISLLHELEHHTDGALSELATRILKDEIRHMEFGIAEIRRMLGNDKDGSLAKTLRKLHRVSLWHASMLAASLSQEARALGIPMGEFTKKTVEEHFGRIRSVNFPLTWLDRTYMRTIEAFLSVL